MHVFSMAASLTSILAVLLTQAATAEETGSTSAVMGPKEIVLPLVDADQGRRLFVAKGCFLCHAINGIGGAAAPALNAPEDAGQLDLMSFVARMWAGASAMIELQSKELGYQIELSGDEIADLAAFSASPEAQRTFSMEEIPETMQDWIIEKPYWMGEGWPETFEQEYYENGLPLDYD